MYKYREYCSSDAITHMISVTTICQYTLFYVCEVCLELSILNPPTHRCIIVGPENLVLGTIVTACNLFAQTKYIYFCYKENIVSVTL
jgi:hypothetical protein